MSTGVGRGYLALDSKGEVHAFSAWMREQIQAGGGRKAVAERSGVSVDMLSKYTVGRAVPSRATLTKLIDAGVLGYATPEDLAAHVPWMESKYRRAPKTAVAPKPTEVEVEAPAVNGEIDLLGAILVHPGITTQQRVQLTALVTLVLSGTQLDISISPRS
jgi:transcriptional regulator with XRE-family HTH domain